MTKPHLIVDAHLDLAWNALQWNRNLLDSVYTIRVQERQTPGKGRGQGTVALPDLRQGRVMLCFATLLARSTGQPVPHLDFPSRTQERNVLTRAMERLDQQIAFQAKLVKQAQSEIDSVMEEAGSIEAELEALAARQQAAEAETRSADERLAALPLEELTAQLAQLRTSAAVASQAAQGQQAIIRTSGPRHATDARSR